VGGAGLTNLGPLMPKSPKIEAEGPERE